MPDIIGRYILLARSDSRLLMIGWGVSDSKPIVGREIG